MGKDFPRIIGYYDYRKYLYDWYIYKKSENKNITYRYIGMKVDIDPGYLVKMMKSQKHLNPEKIPEFAKLLKLEKKEVEYFDILVQFNKSKSEHRSKTLFEKLLTFNTPDCDLITKDRYEFYQHWYHTAIREIVNTLDIKNNYAEVARSLIPQISTRQVKDSLKLLERLAFLERDDDGIYRQTSKFITTGVEWHSIAIRQFHRQAIELAHDAVGNIPTNERDLSCLTMTLTDEGLEKIKEKLAQFRKEVLEICSQESDVDRVYQMNFQLFPMSSKVKKND